MEKKINHKVNYARIAREYNCDPRTVKRYFTQIEENPIKRKPRTIPKLVDGFEAIIEEKYIKNHATAIEVYEVLKNDYKFTINF